MGLSLDPDSPPRLHQKLPKGKQFHRAVRLGWPYLETETHSIRSIKGVEQARHAPRIQKGNATVQKILDQEIFERNHNKSLTKDVKWRARHLGWKPTYWRTAKSDLPWLLSDRALIMKSPPAIKPEISLGLKRQTLQDYLAYQNTYITRHCFQCFTRGDSTQILHYWVPKLANHL